MPSLASACELTPWSPNAVKVNGSATVRRLGAVVNASTRRNGRRTRCGTCQPTLTVVRGLAPQARCRPNGTTIRPGGVSAWRQNAAAGLLPIAIVAAAAAAPVSRVRRERSRACRSAMLSRAASRSGRPMRGMSVGTV